jgi:hypothetical protein
MGFATEIAQAQKEWLSSREKAVRVYGPFPGEGSLLSMRALILNRFSKEVPGHLPSAFRSVPSVKSTDSQIECALSGQNSGMRAWYSACL